ncbi:MULTISPECIES: retroviral-like aspartic protease [unclassified Coleofasciculus]|uniref:retroviral-like aspartic protease n=1 Tax=unclassified Coleofasciculus TaxID=2692782 RepID=UPI00187EC614|nr:MULTISPECIES: retroviral-like aspartic protease [unclassified Coleofasciculus]MBE9126085.1 retroviral-like aspartic protease [Coleofasciculus sp. LEGE 07081]MBE9149499.1 retroviral-like aspartic protease [Coleofasciculus sp. LEGE 07092]
MIDAQRFSFIERLDEFGTPDAVPSLPLILTYRNNSIEVSGLLDTGASVNVLPYDVGVHLGAVWEEQSTSVLLAGNLAPVEARGLVVSTEIRPFAPCRLVFAWSQTDDVPLLLGRMNFFLEFDVCFYRSQLAFEVRPRV